MKRILSLLAVSSLLLAAGCASSTTGAKIVAGGGAKGARGGSAAANGPDLGGPSTLSMRDFNAAAERLVDSMLDDEAFQKKYDRLAGTLGEGRLPVFVAQSVRNATNERIQGRIDAMSRAIRVKIRKSGKFDLKDDRVTQQMVDRIRSSADIGLESGELLNALRSHVSPHYIMTGEVQAFRDGDLVTFQLYLALHDLAGASGDGGLVVWDDIVQIEKLD